MSDIRMFIVSDIKMFIVMVKSGVCPSRSLPPDFGLS